MYKFYRNLLFTSLAVLLAIPTITFSQNHSFQCSLQTGTFYTHPKTNTVWKVVNPVDKNRCTKRPVQSAEVFFTHADSWNVVKQVTKNKIKSIPDDTAHFLPWGPKYNSKGGALIKVPNDPKVYLLLDGKKYWITSKKVFNALNYKWKWIETASKDLLDKYKTKGEINYTDHHPVGTLITYSYTNKVYRIEKNRYGDLTKRHITNERVFNKLGYRFDRVVTVDRKEWYKTGDPINSVKDVGEKDKISNKDLSKETTGRLNEEKTEKILHKKINQVRKSKGLKPLDLGKKLSEAADYHSKDMIKDGYYAHKSPDGETYLDRYKKFNVTCRDSLGAENINKAQYGVKVRYKDLKLDTKNERQVAEATVQMWLHSPPHKRTMLTDKWYKQGLGVELSPNGWVFVTQNFC